jgi:hypothetical protein
MSSVAVSAFSLREGEEGVGFAPGVMEEDAAGDCPAALAARFSAAAFFCFLLLLVILKMKVFVEGKGCKFLEKFVWKLRVDDVDRLSDEW